MKLGSTVSRVQTWRDWPPFSVNVLDAAERRCRRVENRTVVMVRVEVGVPILTGHGVRVRVVVEVLHLEAADGRPVRRGRRERVRQAPGPRHRLGTSGLERLDPAGSHHGGRDRSVQQVVHHVPVRLVHQHGLDLGRAPVRVQLAEQDGHARDVRCGHRGAGQAMQPRSRSPRPRPRSRSPARRCRASGRS